MRLPMLLAAALILSALGAYLIGVDAFRSGVGPRDPAADNRQIQTYTRRDERGRPVCRRRAAGSDQDQVVGIGQACP
jgi:hypothetical protein